MSNGTGIEVEASFRAKLLGFFDQLTAHQRETRAELAKQTQLMQQGAALLPITYRNRAQGTAGATGVLVLDFGAPAQGRVWELRHLVIGGDDPTVVAAGAAYVYRAALAAINVPGALSMGDALDWSTALPTKSTYGAGEIVLVSPEHLYVVLTGCTNGQDYQAGMTVTDRLSTPTERTAQTV